MKKQIERVAEWAGSRATGLVVAAVAVAMLAAGVVMVREAQGQSAPGYYNPSGVIVKSGTTTNAVTTNTVTWTNAIAGATTNIDVTPYVVPQGARETMLEFSFAYTASSTSNAVVVIGRSLNGGNSGTNVEQFLTWTMAGAGTTQVTFCTNLYNANGGGAVPYLYVYSIGNTHASALLTNFTMRATSK